MSVTVSKRHHAKAEHGGPDKIGADEKQSSYPGLDLEDVCKQAKNPKCEAIIDNFCVKSCSASLCAQHGSIRAMCRLMCEAEDLLPQCSKMGPSQLPNTPYGNPYLQAYDSAQIYPQGYGFSQ